MGEDIGQDPSLAAGATIQPHMEQMHAAMSEVVPLLESGDDETAAQAATEYVAHRTQELSALDPRKPIDSEAGGTRTFIGPDTPLTMAGISDSYYMDDPTAYEAAFPTMRAQHTRLRHIMPADRAYLNTVIAGINHGQAYYFGSYFGDDKEKFIASRASDILDLDEDERQTASSISDYKGKATCLERAAVAHNSALIYGVDSNMHIGRLAKTAEDGTAVEEAHAFLTFPNTAGEEHILDPTNPVVTWNDDGTVASISPAIYKRMPGVDRQDVELKEYEIVDGQPVVKNTHKLTYTFDATLA